MHIHNKVLFDDLLRHFFFFLDFGKIKGSLALGLVTSENFFSKTNLVSSVASLSALQTVRRKELHLLVTMAFPAANFILALRYLSLDHSPFLYISDGVCNDLSCMTSSVQIFLHSHFFEAPPWNSELIFSFDLGVS